MFVLLSLVALWGKFSTVQFSCSVTSDSLRPHGLQHARFLVHPRSLLKLLSIESILPSNHLILCCPLLLSPSIFPESGSFPMSQFFTSGGQHIGVSASASVLPMNIQHLFALGWTDWILQPKGLSRVFSNTTVQKLKYFDTAFFIAQLSHPYMTTGKTIALTKQTFAGKVIVFLPRSKHLLISWLQSPSAVT